MISRTKVGTTLAVVSLAALALTACTGANNGTNASACTVLDTDAAAESVPSTGWESADRDAIADGGTLQLAVDATPLNWNTSNLDSGTVDDALLATLYMPSFVEYAEDGSWELNPDFATSVELVSEAPQVVEVKINPAAVWSDGTPMTVDDFAATWGALNGENPDFAPVATNVYEDIESVEAGVDDHDIIITFENTNADWPSILAPSPVWLMDTPKHFNESWVTGPYAADGKTYVSGGPYIVDNFDATGQVVTFVPNPAWWGDAPKLEQIIFKAVSRDGIATAFANNELDVANVYGNADSFATVQTRTDAVVQRSLSTTYRHITLNGTSEVFSDVKVRQAFAQSLDRAVIAEARLKGVGSPVTLLGNLIYLPGQDGYEDDATDVIGCDTDSASSILKDAGYTINEDGFAEKDGTVLTVRFVIPSDNPNSAEVAQQVQAMAKVTGFDVQIDVVPSDDFFASYITTETRDFDATYFAWQGTPFPVSSTQSIFYPADSGQNFPGVTDESLGDDWLAANAELDPAARITLAQEIDKKLVNLVSTVPLFPETYVYGVKTGLVNYGPSQFQSVDWQDVGFLK